MPVARTARVPMVDDLLEGLNRQQREAVFYDEGGALVLAGAGTGKTRVLTGRIVRLIRGRPELGRRLLAVTFTNKAAREMRGRVEAALGGTVAGLALGTFHSLCHRLLRIHAKECGLDKNFQILDSQDQLTFIRRLLRDDGVDEKEYSPQEIRAFVSQAKERGQRAADVATHDRRSRDFAELYERYEQRCRAEHKLDFAELLLAVLDWWRRERAAREHYAERFRHVLVDELQDTNQQQFDWLTFLDSGENCFFGVGDDDQSIYGFRGAKPLVMRAFQSRLRADKLIRLEENYRSVAPILAAANGLIDCNKGRLGKRLVAVRGEGERLRLAPATDDLTEAETVAADVAERWRRGEPLQGMAVLYRTNAQVRLFERKLSEAGVPYRVYGGLRFYDREEVKHVLAFLRLLVGDDRDALVRVINVPPRGIGKKSVGDLFAGGAPFEALAGTTAPKLVAFRALREGLRAVAETGDLPETIRAVVERSGLLAYYEGRREEERAENLRELVTAAAQFQPVTTGEGETPTLSDFLSMVALESGGEEGEVTQAVSLMTVHAAKGLEFDCVYLVGLEEGMFPHENALPPRGGDADMEEERRLMYVALTRAKRSLALHFAGRRMRYGKPVVFPPSRFLAELPEETVEVDSGDGLPSSSPPVPPPSPPPLPRRPVARLPAVKGFRPGDAVRHPRYGAGVVTRQSGVGEEAKTEIAFRRFGIRSFLTERAPIEKV